MRLQLLRTRFTLRHLRLLHPSNHQVTTSPNYRHATTFNYKPHHCHSAHTYRMSTTPTSSTYTSTALSYYGPCPHYPQHHNTPHSTSPYGSPDGSALSLQDRMMTLQSIFSTSRPLQNQQHAFATTLISRHTTDYNYCIRQLMPTGGITTA